MRSERAGHLNLFNFLLHLHLVSLFDRVPTRLSQLLPPLLFTHFLRAACCSYWLVNLGLECALFLEAPVSFLDQTARSLVRWPFLTFAELTANRRLQELGVVRYDRRLLTLDLRLLLRFPSSSCVLLTRRR